MAPAVTGVLKGSRIRLAEPRKLDGPVSQIPPERHPPVTARIIEQAANGAVVEVTCACGAVIHLRCDTEGGPAAANEPSTG
ncbi:MAG TPA: hypothetical protein VM031_07110 [Phycisphaerae bacterium]|nr:hypothetical protein [Phycisphaerae bacterium]